MNESQSIPKNIFDLDYAEEVEVISKKMRKLLSSVLRKRGFVVAISGGIDSSVCAALSVQALGPKKVFGLLLPEKDSSTESTIRGELLAKHLGIEFTTENIAPTLEAIGCYRWRDEAIVRTFPEYGADWKNKIIITGGLEGQINHFKLVVQSPDGEIKEKNLRLHEYLQIVAATNYKQRVRKMVEYFHADRLNYAVVGTPNRLEYDQGFFVKNGDGAADIKPIAHLYKTQVYAMAKYLGLPGKICSAIPTTDTYSLSQGQDEFYFSLPYEKMDIALWSLNNKIPAVHLASRIGVSETQAEFIYKDIYDKRKTASLLDSKAFLLERIDRGVSFD